MVRIPLPPRPPRTPHTTPHPSPHPGGNGIPRRGPHGSGGDNASDVANSKSKFDEFVDAASSIVDIINGILDIAGHIPGIGGLVERIQELIGRMFEKLNEAIQKTVQIFAYVGSPSTLRQTGISWVQSVGTPCTVATGTIIPSALASTGHWTGAAHDAYIARVELQQPASDDVYAKCVMIDEQLNTFADAIVDFWVAFSLAAITTAIGVGLGVAQIVTVWGTPTGVLTIIAEVVSFISNVINLVDIITTANEAAASFMMTVTNELGSVAAYPGGAWPRHAA